MQKKSGIFQNYFLYRLIECDDAVTKFIPDLFKFIPDSLHALENRSEIIAEFTL